MKCPYCKKDIEVNMTFCPHCMSVLKDADVEEFLKVDEIDAQKDPKDVSIKEFIADVIEGDDVEESANSETQNLNENNEQVEINSPEIEIVSPETEEEPIQEDESEQKNIEEEYTPEFQQQAPEEPQSPIWAALWAVLTVLVLGVCIFGYFAYKKYSAPVEYFGLLMPHADIDAADSSIDTRAAATKINEGEFSLSQYMKEAHSQKNKNKLFGIFYNNILYYTEVMGYKYNEQMYDKCSPLQIDDRPGVQTYDCDGLELKFNVKVEYDTDYEGKPYHYTLINDVKITSPETKSIYPVGDGEGGYVFLPDYSYLDAVYSKYLTQDWQDYLKLKAGEQDDLDNKPMFADGYLTVDLKRLADWIIWLNEFNKKYPKFELSSKVIKDIHEYTGVLLWTEYRTFDSATNKMTAKAKLAYEYFINKADEKSEEYQVVKECYEALKAQDYQYNPDFREVIEKWNKKWAKENNIE